MLKKLSQSSRKIAFISSAIFIFILVGIVATNAAFMFDDHIYHGIHVGNVPVGGLSISEAQEKLENEFSAKLNQPITLVYEQQKWEMMPTDIDMYIDTQAMAEQAYQVGRTGNFFSCLMQRYQVINGGYQIPLIVNCNQTKLLNYFTEIARVLNKAAQKASIESRGAKLNIIPEVVGQEVDIAANIAQFTNLMNQHIVFSYPIIINQLIPSVTTNDLSEIDTLIASFTTSFYTSTWNRSQNIMLAAKAINGVVIKPREIFSFNDIVGFRSPKNGYKRAPAYIDGELVDDWGGGVCQVSSTLYNAVLYANLDIVERSVHLRPAGYVSLGRDATVADGQIDFKFKNPFSSSIYISAYVHDSQVTINIFGKGASDQPEIRLFTSNVNTIEPKTINKPDAELFQGKIVVEKEGQPGYIVTTYRIKYINGQEVDRELLGTDEYPPVDKVIKVGTKINIKQPSSVINSPSETPPNQNNMLQNQTIQPPKN